MRLKHWVPSINEMKERKINTFEVIQKPGDAVFVGYGIIHWVSSPVSMGQLLSLSLRMVEPILPGTGFGRISLLLTSWILRGLQSPKKCLL
jgi:hypothetical protein